MKNLPIIALLAVVGVTRAEVVTPVPLDRTRYTETLAKSPFVLETKVNDAPVVEKVNPFKDMYVRGIGKADGKDYVVVQKMNEERAMRFVGSEPGEDSIVVKSVQIGANFHDTKVVLQKGDETGEIGFSEQAITAVPQPIQVRPPNTPPQFNQQVRPPGAMPTVRAGGTTPNPVIPRPQFAAPIQMPKPVNTGVTNPAFNQGSGMRPPDSNRRLRTTVIKN